MHQRTTFGVIFKFCEKNTAETMQNSLRKIEIHLFCCKLQKRDFKRTSNILQFFCRPLAFFRRTSVEDLVFSMFYKNSAVIRHCTFWRVDISDTELLLLLYRISIKFFPHHKNSQKFFFENFAYFCRKKKLSIICRI